MSLLPILPNWNSAVRDSRAFATGIVTSERGYEQRWAMRETPRRTIDFTALLHGIGVQDFARLLAASQNQELSMPDPVGEPAFVSVAVPEGGSAFGVSNKPDWLVSGVNAVLIDGETMAEVRANLVTDTTIYLSAPTTRRWTIGAYLLPRVQGRLPSNVRMQMLTDAAGEPEISFAVTPGSEDDDLRLDSSVTFYDGREVVHLRPNWASPLSIQFVDPYETVDFNAGIIKVFSPIEFNSRLTQFTYLLRDRAAIKQLLGFFQRAKGQRGEMYIPSWTEDFTLRQPIGATSTTIFVTDPLMASVYADREDYHDLCVITRSGRILGRQIMGITSDADGSTITINSPFGLILNSDPVAKLCWFPLSRWSVDLMTIEYVTNSVARCVLTATTLPWAVAEESPYGYGLDEGSKWLIEQFGYDLLKSAFMDPIQVAVNETYPDITENL